MKKSLIIILLVFAPSINAMKAHNATIIGHTSTVSGVDDKGHAVEGHIKNCDENFIMKFFKKHTEKKVTKSKCSCSKQ
jgi:hypothetical protein